MSPMRERLATLDSVSFWYAGSKRPALRNVTLRVHRGDFILVTGPSGCGKSTLCRLLNGLIPHFFRGRLEGEVVVMGYDVRKTPTHVLARHVGMVFQNPENQLFLSSVEKEIVFGLENLGLPREEIRRRLEEVIELFDLSEIRDRPPYELSGGQQQRVAIAAVVAMGPEVLVLDEPTAHLDPASSKEVIDLVLKLNRELGTTLILVEHRLELVAPHASRVVVMSGGAVVAEGPPREVLPSPAAEGAGVNLPKVVRLYSSLRSRGLALPLVPLTPEELAEAVRLARVGVTRGSRS